MGGPAPGPELTAAGDFDYNSLPVSKEMSRSESGSKAPEKGLLWIAAQSLSTSTGVRRYSY